MSMTERFYYGPFVSCATREVKREDKVRCCPDKDCSLHLAETSPPDSYCRRCGAVIGLVPVMRRDVEPAWADVSEAIHERLFCAQVFMHARGGRKAHCWLPNVKWSRPGLDLNDSGPEVAIEVTRAEIVDDLAAFEEFFRPELETLIQFYGLGGRRLVWGHVFYFI